MKKYIIFSPLIFIVNKNFSEEIRENSYIITHQFYEELPPYRQSEIISHEELPSYSESQTIAKELMRNFPTTEISLTNKKRFAGILHNEEENFFITLADSKFITTSDPRHYNLITTSDETPQILHSLFDCKSNEGYLCSGSEKLIIVEINSDNYSAKASIQLSKKNKHKPANQCVQAYFNTDTKPNQCFSSTSDGKVRLWDYGQNPIRKLKTFVRIENTVFPPCISFNRDNGLLLAQTALRAFSIFDQRIVKPIKIISTPEPITGITHNNNSICLALTNETHSQICCMDLRNCIICNNETNVPATATHLSFNHKEGNSKILAGTDEGEVFCVDTINKKVYSLKKYYAPFKAHDDGITAVNWSSYGHPLSTSIDGFARIWHKGMTTMHSLDPYRQPAIQPLQESLNIDNLTTTHEEEDDDDDDDDIPLAITTDRCLNHSSDSFLPIHRIERTYRHQRLDEIQKK